MFKTFEEVQAKYPIGTDAEDFESVYGYIYDGRYWYPAEVTWDGWVPIREEEKDEGNSVV